jgi:hypothetical protein
MINGWIHDNLETSCFQTNPCATSPLSVRPPVPGMMRTLSSLLQQRISKFYKHPRTNFRALFSSSDSRHLRTCPAAICHCLQALVQFVTGQGASNHLPGAAMPVPPSAGPSLPAQRLPGRQRSQKNHTTGWKMPPFSSMIFPGL